VAADVLQHVCQRPAVTVAQAVYERVTAANQRVRDAVRFDVDPGKRVVNLATFWTSGEESGPDGDLLGDSKEGFGLERLVFLAAHVALSRHLNAGLVQRTNSPRTSRVARAPGRTE
jgi:hypothetical protein